MSYWMLYPRCMAAKPVVCKFSTSILLYEGCFLVAEIANYVLKTKLCVSLAGRWSSLAWTINTCEVVVSKHLVILLWKVTRTLFQYCGKQSCSHNTLPSSFPILTPTPSQVLSWGNNSRCIYCLGGSLHGTKRGSQHLGLGALACSKSPRFHLLTFLWDRLRKYVLCLFLLESGLSSYHSLL